MQGRGGREKEGMAWGAEGGRSSSIQEELATFDTVGDLQLRSGDFISSRYSLPSLLSLPNMPLLPMTPGRAIDQNIQSDDVSHSAPATSPPVLVKNRRKCYLDRHPEYFSADLELAGPLALSFFSD